MSGAVWPPPWLDAVAVVNGEAANAGKPSAPDVRAEDLKARRRREEAEPDGAVAKLASGNLRRLQQDAPAVEGLPARPPAPAAAEAAAPPTGESGARDQVDTGATLEMLRAAAEAGEYGIAVTALCEALEYSDPLSLLPLLRGMFSEVIKIDDRRQQRDAGLHGAARDDGAEPGLSPFMRFKANGAPSLASESSRGGMQHGVRTAVGVLLPEASPGAMAPEPRESSPARRWRRAIRVMFDEDAALALLGELVECYNSPEFRSAARQLNLSWVGQSDLKVADQSRDMQRLCLRTVEAPVLQRFGFSPDERGSREVEAVVMTLAEDQTEIQDLQRQVKSRILQNFTNFGCND